MNEDIPPMPDLLTTEELNELEDLEGWIEDVFVFAGMKLPRCKTDTIASKIRHENALTDAAVDRVRQRVMSELFPDYLPED